MASTVAAL
jgi:hypothetical protein